MKKNRPNEIRKCIDSLTALMICEEKERAWLASTLDIMIIQHPPVLHVANERELTEIAHAYKADITVEPVVSQAFTNRLSIELNGVKLFTLA